MSSKPKRPRRTSDRLAPARRSVYLKVQYLRGLEKLVERWASCLILETLVKNQVTRLRASKAQRQLLDTIWERRAYRKAKKAGP